MGSMNRNLHMVHTFHSQNSACVCHGLCQPLHLLVNREASASRQNSDCWQLPMRSPSGYVGCSCESHPLNNLWFSQSSAVTRKSAIQLISNFVQVTNAWPLTV